jgi:hypothetical protein
VCIDASRFNPRPMADAKGKLIPRAQDTDSDKVITFRRRADSIKWSKARPKPHLCRVHSLGVDKRYEHNKIVVIALLPQYHDPYELFLQFWAKHTNHPYHQILKISILLTSELKCDNQNVSAAIADCQLVLL